MIRLLVQFALLFAVLGIVHIRVIVPVNQPSSAQPENALYAHESISFHPVENPSQQGDIRVLKNLITKTRSVQNPNRFVSTGSDADNGFNTFLKGFNKSDCATFNSSVSATLPIYIRCRKLII